MGENNNPRRANILTKLVALVLDSFLLGLPIWLAARWIWPECNLNYLQAVTVSTIPLLFALCINRLCSEE